MADGLRGTVALMTGASSGIGAATAAALARKGASVALVARRRDRLQAVAAGIRDAGGSALVVEADITSQTQAATAVKRTVAESGRPDAAVNNAGLMLLESVAEAPDGKWERMIAVNLHPVLHLTKAALPRLHELPRQAETPR